ncbi:unnamed protein product [Caenorhabditis nigoni]
MKTYWGKAGTPITIPCSINLYNEENFSLDWRKDGQLILSAFGQEQGHVTPTLQGKKAFGFIGLGTDYSKKQLCICEISVEDKYCLYFIQTEQ